ncbi:NAD-dependent malic enzyme 1 [Sporosarcina sp. P13]|uniref:NAD-dependent malic enzyme n=1 Tax=Sporosarcina sp. P13 TaxID=2048263 RepID=UPI000C168C2E|nr:NAD(P)-dependent oxidoreductase [Sporosarcina sp. P13]PIC64270.1 NAD-dependent malic enzyme 1 [Sporosarcina sp. P13]
MAQGQFLRNLIIETPSRPGNLGKVTMAIGQLGGDIGDIQTIKVGTVSTIREIGLQCNDKEHLAEIVEAVENLKHGIKVHAVTDDVLQAHEGGKIHMKATTEIRSLADLRRVYTPGVASVCKTIQKDPEQANYFTGISNTVAIVTDGTAILGLGDIGPIAGMPVMEGKAVLFDQFVGISGIPILLNTSDPDEVVETIKHIYQGFGAILLEDIGSPHCFEIEERLKKELPIPVMHDDQHGTAVVALAAALTACKHVGVDLANSSVGQIGLGAAGLAISRMFMAYGVDEMKGTDPNPKATKMLADYGGTVVESMEEIMATCDLVIATTGVANLIKPEMVRKGQIILALSNPNAEIAPDVALEAGAAYAADGRLVNNVLGFPGIFRGALNANAKSITYSMLIAAALAIVESTKRDDLVPHPLDPNVHINVALAVEKVVYEEQGE